MAGSSWHQTSLENRLGDSQGGRRGSEVANTLQSPLWVRADLGTRAPLLLVPFKQRCPVQPGGQKQLPSWGWQVSPWGHWQGWAQLSPQCPGGHAAGDKVCLPRVPAQPSLRTPDKSSAPSITEIFLSALVSRGHPGFEQYLHMDDSQMLICRPNCLLSVCTWLSTGRSEQRGRASQPKPSKLPALCSSGL